MSTRWEGHTSYTLNARLITCRGRRGDVLEVVPRGPVGVQQRVQHFLPADAAFPGPQELREVPEALLYLLRAFLPPR